MGDVFWAADPLVRIAFVVNNYPPRTGGVELHVQALAQAMLRLGHEPLVVTLGSEASVDERDGVTIVTLREHMRVAGILGFPSIGTKRKLIELFRDRGISAVSVHTRFFPMSYIGYRAAGRSGVPLIHTEHGSGHVASDSFVVKWASRLVDWTVGRAVLRGAEAVLGVSEEVCAFVKQLSGVEAGVFYNAINLDGIAPEHLTPKPNRWVFVGRLVPGKGWEVFLDLLSREKKLGRTIDGHVLGDGPDMLELVQLLKTLGLEDDVIVHGRVNQSVVRELLKGSMLVNPTVLSEGFQTTLLEAIAEGGRVLTYPVPGANMLKAQGAPVCVSKEATPEALFSALRSIEGRWSPPASPELIEQWGWEKRGQQFAGILESIAGKARSN